MGLRLSGKSFGLALMTALLAHPAAADDLPSGVVSVYYAFKLGHNPPTAGQSFCHIGKECKLTFDVDPVTLTLSLGAPSHDDNLDIDCRDVARRCELRESSAPTQLLREMGIRGFRIFAVEYDEGNFLIYHRQIGTVTLQIHRPQPNPARGI
jgi:hypothetical protein